jgi:hypothetical protein
LIYHVCAPYCLLRTEQAMSALLFIDLCDGQLLWAHTR